jgi:hypothetical protein
MYAKVENNAVVKYPYSIENLRLDNPKTSFTVTALSNSALRDEYGIVEVQSVDRPSAEGKSYSEGTPTLDGITWKQSWDETSLSAEVVAAIREKEVIDARMVEYGSVEEQLEYIVENGIDVFITRQETIKTNNPKP